ncbi:hypothetical protein GTA08_BOTSDO05047 [Neofusicoccum parvum]|uniref:Uncharacterized protein n=1 Tax=Neofusicoccum parvum TaxID=310453 RepID=A0ACB5RWU1_9PEZI|nr:hypothetical protein GTA08_BOTSDO05047 [Neofusicoccum parvum]
MDLNSLLHAHNKIMADRASNTTVRNNAPDQQQANTPPPAYSTLTSHHPAATTTATPNPTPTPDDPDELYTSSSTASPASTGGATTPAQTLAIDAATLIHGSNNIITVPPVDGPRLTAILLSLLHGNLPTQQAAAARHQQQQQNQAFPVHHPGHLPGSDRSRPLSVRINCGVRIVGDRNATYC